MGEVERFLPARLYMDPAVHHWDCEGYAGRYWHPLAAAASLAPGHSMALTLLGQPLLLTRPEGGAPRAFLNRCPHRGVAFQEEQPEPIHCPRLICPCPAGHALEDIDGRCPGEEFTEPFQRDDWPLTSLPCVVDGPLIWVALQADVTPLDDQLELVHREIDSLWTQPLDQVRMVQRRSTATGKSPATTRSTITTSLWHTIDTASRARFGSPLSASVRRAGDTAGDPPCRQWRLSHLRVASWTLSQLAGEWRCWNFCPTARKPA